MSNAGDEIARLRADLESLRGAVKTALALAQVAHETALCLAVTHPNPEAALAAFNEIASVADDPMLYSEVSDDDLARVEELRSTVRETLLPALQTGTPHA